MHSRQRKSLSEEREQEAPHPPLLSNPRKSSIRKSLSQGDVRCLSPEVLASVKKTVSFSDEILDKPTRLLKPNEKELTKEIDADQPNVNLPEAEVGKPETEVDKPEVDLHGNKRETEESNPEVDQVCNRLDTNEDTLCSTGQKHDIKSTGVVIQNGQESMEHFQSGQHKGQGPIRDKPMSPTDVIAKVKEATRCSCHVEGCHCRDITRPTMAVLSQAKAAAKESHSSPKQKLLVSKI